MKPDVNDDFLKERLDKYDRWLTAKEIPYASKVVPVSESINTQKWVLSGRQALDQVLAADAVALTRCVCRSNYRRCDNPVEICFLLNSAAEKGLADGRARRVDRDEAEAVLQQADEKGLIHLSFVMPGDEIYAFCSCCACCCHDLQLLKVYHREHLVARSDYVAETAMDECTHCGICIDRCAFGARRWLEEGEGEMVYDPNACYGCGLCVSSCSPEATTMKNAKQ